MPNHDIYVNNVPNEITVFKKILAKTDIENQLIVPARVLEQFPVGPEHKRNFTAYDQHRTAWPFVLANRHDPHSYRKPILNQGEWQKFVRAYNLGAREDDAVVFFIPHDDPDHLHVRALKKVLLFKNKTPVWTEF